MQDYVADELAAIWERERHHVRRLLVKITRDPELAEDLTQETYLHAHVAFHNYRGGEIKAWLAVIARNAFFAYARRKFFRSEILLESDILVADNRVREHPTCPELDAAVADLAPTLRTPFLLKHRDGYTYEDVAEMLDLPVGTVKSRTSRAARCLRGTLGPAYEEAIEMSAQLSGRQLHDFLYGQAQEIGSADSIDREFTIPSGETVDEDGVSSECDPRLSQRVSYTAFHKPVKQVVADLSKLCGVALKSGSDNRDWQVRDRRMNIQVDSIQLSDIMNSLARVMIFRWSRTADAKPTYRLYADRPTVSHRQAEWRVNSQELRKRISEKRSAFLDRVAEVAAMSDAEAEKLKERNLYLWLMHNTRDAQFTTAVFAEIPGLREAFVNIDRNLWIPVTLLSPETKKLLLFNMRAYYSYYYGRDRQYPAEFESRVDEGGVAWEMIPRPFTRADRDQLTNYRGPGCGLPGHFFLLGRYYDPDIAWAEFHTRWLILTVDGGMDRESASRQLHAESGGAGSKPNETERYLPLDPVVAHADEPWLHQPINIRECGTDRLAPMQSLIAAVAEATGLGVISDSFYHAGLWLGEGDPVLKDVLKPIDHSYNWHRQEGLIEFRSRDWFRYRSSQIPEEWIEKWRKSFASAGRMSFEEFSQFGVLTYEQIEENVLYDPVLSQSIKMEDWNLMGSKELLRLYVALEDRQREQVFEENGLDLNEVPPDLWQFVVYIFHYKNTWSGSLESFLDRTQQGIRLTARSVTGDDGMDRCVFEAIVGTTDTETFTWEIDLPVFGRMPPRA